MKMVVLIMFFLGSILGVAMASDYRHGDELTLLQKDGAKTREPGKAQLTFDGESLILIAELIDSHIANSADQHNVKTWTTGDVLEFFFQPAGRTDYYEFHVTPNGKTLQLHIPSVDQLRVVPFEEQIFESNFQSEAKIESGRWTAKMVIPLAALGEGAAFDKGKFAVCRYNYNPSWPEPELSSSTPLPKSFHSPAEWHVVRSK